MKIWAEGEILTAKDINDNLNPATAENIPYAMAAGFATITGTGTSSSQAQLALPLGRFSVVPVITAISQNSLYLVSLGSATTTSFYLTIRNITGGNFTGGVNVRWQAIQMTNNAAEG